MATTNKYLRIYLNDHRAAARAGLALANRCLERNRGTGLGQDLAVVVGEIDDDLSTLERVASALDIPADPLKNAAARAGEVVARLKLNGAVRQYSPLSRLLELESLLAGIDAKRSLWLSLQTSLPNGVAGVDFRLLADRAGGQRDRLAPHHREAAALAFRGSDDGQPNQPTAAASR